MNEVNIKHQSSEPKKTKKIKANKTTASPYFEEDLSYNPYNNPDDDLELVQGVVQQHTCCSSKSSSFWD
jgi:hypothetical protein